MEYKLLRAYSWLNRFGTLARAKRVFRDLSPAKFVRRPLFGYEIDLDLSRSTAQQLLLLEGERFVDERFLLGRLLRTGMTVVDVGANIGYYLLMFESHIGPSGTVICIEPSAENLPELHRNVEINGLRNVTVHAVAIGAADGVAGLRSGINSGVVESDGAAYRVPVKRLDQLIHGKADLLKIDVEGYEGQVIEGAAALIEEYRPIIFLELHPHIVGQFGYSIAGILERLRSWYGSVSLYDREKPSSQAFWRKVSVRYLEEDPLRLVADQEAYIRHYESGLEDHTFWAVAVP